MRVALAGQRLEFADQRLDQRRLAGAVGAEQADAVAGFEAEADVVEDGDPLHLLGSRSEEHTSELQSLMRISYAVFCLKKKTTKIKIIIPSHNNIMTHATSRN